MFWAGRVAQVVTFLPIKHEDPKFKHRYHPKQKERKKAVLLNFIPLWGLLVKIKGLNFSNPPPKWFYPPLAFSLMLATEQHFISRYFPLTSLFFFPSRI
jgi:hypothetical protein